MSSLQVQFLCTVHLKVLSVDMISSQVFPTEHHSPLDFPIPIPGIEWEKTFKACVIAHTHTQKKRQKNNPKIRKHMRGAGPSTHRPN